MKRIKKLLGLILVLFTSFSLLSNTSFASSNRGIEVELTTDKDTYSANEVISSTLSVTNRRDNNIEDLSLRMFIPNDYEIVENIEDHLYVKSLEPNAKVRLDIKLRAKTNSISQGQNSISRNNEDGSEASNARSNPSTTGSQSTTTKPSNNTNQRPANTDTESTDNPDNQNTRSSTITNEDTNQTSSITNTRQYNSFTNPNTAPTYSSITEKIRQVINPSEEFPRSSVTGESSVPSPNVGSQVNTGATTPHGDIIRSNVGANNQVRTGVESLLPVLFILILALILLVISRKKAKKKLIGLIIIGALLASSQQTSYALNRVEDRFTCSKTIKVDGKDITLNGQVIINDYEAKIENQKKEEKKANRISPVLKASVNVFGRAVKAEDKNATIPDVKLEVYDKDKFIDQTVTDKDGNYELNLQPGNYNIKISHDGYEPFTLYQPIKENEHITIGDLRLVKDTGADYGNAKITISDAKTGDLLPNTLLLVREGWNAREGEVVDRQYTDALGLYDFTLKPGNYTIETQKEGYINNFINIVAYDNNQSMEYANITQAKTDDSYTIILEWGDDPKDLDAYVSGKSAVNNKDIKVFFANVDFNNGKFTEVSLDRDDKNYFGPETMTINPVLGSDYQYSVRNYHNGIILPNTKVTIYRGDKLQDIYYMPNLKGNRWEVFEIDKEGNFKFVNKVYNDNVPGNDNSSNLINPIIPEEPTDPIVPLNPTVDENIDLSISIKDKKTNNLLAGVKSNIYFDNKLKASGESKNDGRLSLSLKPGTYEISLAKAGYKLTSEKFEVKDKPKEQNILFALEPIDKTFKGIKLEGSIRDGKNNEPIKEAEVILYKEGKEAYKFKTSDKGSIDEKIKPGTYLIEAKKEGYKTITKTLIAAEDKPTASFAIDLPPITYDDVEVKIFVKDEKGKTIDKARVLINESEYETKTDGPIIDNLKPGIYDLAISKDKYLSINTKLEILGNEKSVEKVYTLYDKTYDTVKVKGNLKTEEGPIGQNEIVFEKDGKKYPTATDAEGNFTIDLPNGTYILILDEEKYEPGQIKVEIPNKEELALDLEIKIKKYPEVTYTIKAVDGANNKALDKVDVKITGPDTDINMAINAEGSLSLKPGSYKIAASRVGYDFAEADLNVTGKKANETITLSLVKTTYDPVEVYGSIADEDKSIIDKGTISFSQNGNLVETSQITNGDYKTKLSPGIYEVTIEAENYDANKQSLEVFDTNKEQKADFVIGKKTYEDIKLEVLATGKGQAIDKAKLILTNKANPDEIYEKETTSDGRASLTIKPGIYDLNISAEGFKEEIDELEIGNNKQKIEKVYDLSELIYEEVTFTPTVTDGENPISKAKVTVKGNNVNQTIETDDLGKVSFKLPRGIYALNITKNRYNDINENLLIDGKSQVLDPSYAMTLITYDKVSLSGTIFDFQTKPLKNAKITVYKADSIIDSFTTKDDGKYNFALVPDTYKLEVIHNRHHSKDRDVILLNTKADAKEDFNLDLLTYDSVELNLGVIALGPDRNPIKGAEVEIGNDSGFIHKEITKDDGTIRLNLAPGKYSASARKDGFKDGFIRVITVDNLYPVHKENILLDKIVFDQVNLTGQVIGPKGEPVANGTIDFLRNNQIIKSAPIEAGKYETILDRADYKAIIKAENYQNHEEELKISGFDKDVKKDYELKAMTYANVSVAGEVVGDDGKKIEKGTIKFTKNILIAATTDIIDGAYSINLTPGMYDVEINAAGYDKGKERVEILNTNKSQKEDFTINQIRYTEIDFGANVISEGKNIPNVTIELKDDANKTESLTTSENGRAEGRIKPGKYQLRIETPGYNLYQKEIDIKDTIKTQNEVFELIPITYETVDFKAIVKSANKNLKDVNITISDNKEPLIDKTDMNGEVNFKLNPGTYEISMEKEGYKPKTMQLEIEDRYPSKTVNYELDLITYPKTKFYGKVYEKGANQALDGAMVEISSDNGIVSSAETKNGGKFSFDLTAGDYEAVIKNAKYNEEKDTISIKNTQSEVKKDYELEKTTYDSIKVTVKLVDEDNNPLSNQDSSLTRPGDGWIQHYPVDKDKDYFEIDLSPGKYIIDLYKPGYEPKTEEIIVADDEPTKEVILKLNKKTYNQVNFSGLITDKESKPIVEAKVSLISEDGKNSTYQTSTDINGNYSIAASPGDYKIVVEKDHYVPKSENVTLEQNNLKMQRDYRLDHFVTLGGRVMTDDGFGHEGKIRFLTEPAIEYSTNNGPYSVEILPGVYDAVVIIDGIEHSFNNIVVNNDDLEQTYDFILKTSQTLTIEGKLVDESDNSPVDEAKLKFVNTRDNQRVYYTTSDKVGNYKIELPYAPYDITISHEEVSFRSDTLIPKILKYDYIKDYKGSRAEFKTVDLTISTTDGSSILEDVDIVIEKDGQIVHELNSTEIGTTRVQISPGIYTFRLSKDKYKTRTKEVNISKYKPSENLEFALEIQPQSNIELVNVSGLVKEAELSPEYIKHSNIRFEGSVVDEFGNPASYANVSYTGVDGITRNTRTDSFGRFSVNVTEGNYKFRINNNEIAEIDADIYISDKADASSYTFETKRTSQDVIVTLTSSADNQKQVAGLPYTLYRNNEKIFQGKTDSYGDIRFKGDGSAYRIDLRPDNPAIPGRYSETDLVIFPDEYMQKPRITIDLTLPMIGVSFITSLTEVGYNGLTGLLYNEEGRIVEVIYVYPKNSNFPPKTHMISIGKYKARLFSKEGVFEQDFEITPRNRINRVDISPENSRLVDFDMSKLVDNNNPGKVYLSNDMAYAAMTSKPEPVPEVRINDRAVSTNVIYTGNFINNPIAYSEVEAREGWNNTTSNPINIATTDKEGKFNFRLKPGEYTILARSNNYLSKSINISIDGKSTESMINPIYLNRDPNKESP